MTWLKKLIASFICLVFAFTAAAVFLNSASIPSTLAQTLTPTPFPTPPPKSQGASVSATMPDIVPPSAPILISPSNGLLVTIARPQFVWQESTDNVAISHYQLTIDGDLEIDNINTEGSYDLYNLSYDPLLGYYYLTPNYDLGQGTHTWKITAVDTSDLKTDSATWLFTIDSIAPSFVITDIADLEVSISAQDSNTVPDTAIELSENEPELTGTGEANSDVQLTVIIPDDDNLNRTFSIDVDGSWTHTLPILPRDQEITLDFIITDQAGHISVLEGVKIIIPTEEIIIPAQTATPTLAPGEPTLTPETTPAPEISLEVTPEPTKEPIRIPIIPPKEIVHRLIMKMPKTILRATRTTWFQAFLRNFGPWLVLLIVLLPHIIQTILIAQQFGPSLSAGVLIKIWQAAGTIPYLNRQGWAFDVLLALAAARRELEANQDLEASQDPQANQDLEASQKQQTKQKYYSCGVPFAELTVLSQSKQLDKDSPDEENLDKEEEPPVIKYGLTDKDGLYLPFDLPPNDYRLSLVHPDYNYPSRKKLPKDIVKTITIADYYQAQAIRLQPDSLDFSLQIPTDPIRAYSPSHPKNRFSLLTKIKLKLARIIHYQSWWNLAILLFVLLILLFYPSPANWAALILYLALGIFYKQKDNILANITGVVVDKEGTPLPNALVRLRQKEKADKTWASLTDKNGKFHFYMMEGKFEVTAAKLGYQEKAKADEDGAVEAESWWEEKELALIMEPGNRAN